MLTLGTKAETLKELQGKLQNANVLPLVSFTLKEWKLDKERFWDECISMTSGKPMIVRSSCLNEDTSCKSNAGKYLSIPDVSNKAEFEKAVECVFASYVDSDDGATENENDQILVQPMLEDVAASGVAFTMDPSTGGNYYVINYDKSGSTDGITSGADKGNVLFYSYKQAAAVDANTEQDSFLGKLISALAELEELFGKNDLDVEFAVDSRNAVYILQTRALCMNVSPASEDVQTAVVKGIHAKLSNEQSGTSLLCGDRAIYSVMTDWNPAEMIGIYPKALALSLYREIITDNVWAYQRDNYGYRNMRSFPLMVEFGGIPYIDVRVSFNSFIPKGLDDEISDKLVNYYLDRLAEHPEEHDKAEFNIVFSCYTFDLPERIQVLEDYGFTEDEIEKISDALREVTNQIIDHDEGLWRNDSRKIEKLRSRYDKIVDGNMSDIEKVYWLLEDCKRYGTLPFAGLARGAFVAVELLKSMVAVGVLTDDDYQGFMNGIDSVSSQMSRDLAELDSKAFLEKYGHLRPGTYDITSPRYDEAPELYFDESKCTNSKPKTEQKEFRLSMEQMHLLREHVLQSGLNNDVLELLDFIKNVIEGREYGKFMFTRNLSKALQLIGKIGKSYGISEEDMAYMNIRTVYDLYSTSRDAEDEIRTAIDKGKKEYALKTPLRLPPVIVEPKNVLNFYYPTTKPNFITMGRVSGNIVDIEAIKKNERMDNEILVIPGADPGYDWIFSRGISGFITKYGGANSHMAIRAAEQGITAAIGVGEKLYEKCCKANAVEIDAAAQKITILR